MNNDLISRKYVVAELLKEREQYPPMVAERYSLGVKLPHNFNMAMRGGIRKGLRIAETAPAVDAEPVRHGRWIEEEPAVYKCSECGFTFTTGDPIEKFVYCRCGAKMDGDENGKEKAD